MKKWNARDELTKFLFRLVTSTGDFSKAKVNLANNTLTTLSEGVFKGMLQQMSANLGGFLDVSFSKLKDFMRFPLTLSTLCHLYI